MPSVVILNGPNLNLLGTREPGIYGSATLADVERLCAERASALGLAADFRQTNSEGVLVDWLQEAGAAHRAGSLIGCVLNAGAYTHTSIAIADAVRATGLPVIEVHLSNVHAREPFRHHSTLSPIARGIIVGLGPLGYALAIEALAQLARTTDS